MGREKTNPSKQLNPNWASLCQKLNRHGGPTSKAHKSQSETQNSILGKRKERSNMESDESGADPLAPTSSNFSLTDAMAMDCEMVGVSALGNKSALGRATLLLDAGIEIDRLKSKDGVSNFMPSHKTHFLSLLDLNDNPDVVNQWGNVIYDEFVRPVDRVVDFRTQISGIRPRDLRKAKDFRVVQKKVAELIKGRILVGHALRNDLKALLLSHPKTDIRDTSEYQPFLKEGRSRALKNLASQFLDVNIQNGEHCPIEDARAAMLLYQKSKKEWEGSIKNNIRLKQKPKKRKPKKKPNQIEVSGVSGDAAGS